MTSLLPLPQQQISCRSAVDRIGIEVHQLCIDIVRTFHESISQLSREQRSISDYRRLAPACRRRRDTMVSFYDPCSTTNWTTGYVKNDVIGYFTGYTLCEKLGLSFFHDQLLRPISQRRIWSEITPITHFTEA